MAKFPDLTGDGEVTQADILKGRGVYKKGGSVKNDHGHKPMAKMSHGGHYCWGGKVMKKAKGGNVAPQTEAQRMGSARSSANKAYDSYFNYSDQLNDDIKNRRLFEEGNDSDAPDSLSRSKREKRAEELGQKARNASAKSKIAAEQAGYPETENQYKKGGMAKGGNWIQSAIKKPGALKKSLGVPMDKPIPAAKLEKASKAPGKMGQRARMAMTLKGMK